MQTFSNVLLLIFLWIMFSFGCDYFCCLAVKITLVQKVVETSTIYLKFIC
jgi:hypothetical protein